MANRSRKRPSTAAASAPITPAGDSASDRSRLGRHGGFALAALAALALLSLAYSNHFDNAFHFDDSHVIQDNLYIRSLSNAGRFFTDAGTFSSLPQNAVYRPLLTLSYALDYRLGGGLAPRQFHITQFALLVLLGAVLAALFRRLFDLARPGPANRWAGLFGATLFCIHTANTETVNYLSSRSSLVATFGVAGSLLVYVAWPRGRRLHLYLLPMAVGSLAKPIAVMFAPILLAHLHLLERRQSLLDFLRPRQWPRLWPALWRAVPAFVAGAALYLFVDRMNTDTLNLSNVGAWRYALSQPFVWLHYVRLFLLPVGLTADTDWTFDTTVGSPSLWLGLWFVAGLVALAVWMSRRPGLAPAAFGLAWFCLALLPSSSVVALSEVYNEHHIFFPYVGLALAAAWLGTVAMQSAAAARALPGRRAAAAALVLALAALAAHGLGTYRRNRVWRTGESLWADVVEKSPRNGRAWMNYGVVQMSRGEYRRALELFDHALTLTPNYVFLEINLGVCKVALGDDSGAEAHFLRALSLAPQSVDAHHHYGRWLAGAGRATQAIDELERALALSPASLDSRELLLRLYAAAGDEAKLARLVAETLQLVPGEATALRLSRGEPLYGIDRDSETGYIRLGRTYEGRKDHVTAANVYRYAVTVYPDSAVLWNNLGAERMALGLPGAALPCFERAIERDPALQIARNNLAWARAEAGR